MGRRLRTPADILRDARTIAVVGASPKQWRPAHFVMEYLIGVGYRVLPVRPEDCDQVLGVRCVTSLRELDEPVDLVDVFRRREACPDVARDAVAIGARALWLQVGIVSPEARRIAEDGGLEYVENECTMVVHRRFLAHGEPMVPPAGFR
jgi:predicted CoA-binding protein